MEKDLPIDKQALLDAFFSGRLDDTERKRFDEYFEEDAAFREAYEFQTDVKKALQHQDIAAFRDQLKSIEASRTVEQSYGRMLWVWLSAAAVVIVAGYLVYSTAWRIESDQDLFQHYFDVQANIHNPITRSAQEPSVEYQAFVAYESQNWPLAQSLLDSAMSVDNRPEYALYLANVYMVQRRFDQALPLLEHYLESGDMYSDRALWFLALSHLALDQKDRSIEYLNEMVRLQSYPHEQAAELLSKLK